MQLRGNISEKAVFSTVHLPLDAEASQLFQCDEQPQPKCLTTHSWWVRDKAVGAGVPGLALAFIFTLSRVMYGAIGWTWRGGQVDLVGRHLGSSVSPFDWVWGPEGPAPIKSTTSVWQSTRWLIPQHCLLSSQKKQERKKCKSASQHCGAKYWGQHVALCLKTTWRHSALLLLVLGRSWENFPFFRTGWLS